MDKYEFNIKLEQIKKLAAKKEYKQAAEIAKQMNWNKVKDWSTLATIINVQEAAGDYEEARDMAILAYNRNLGGRKLIYKLTEFFIKVDDFENAEELYREYAKLSARTQAHPPDSNPHRPQPRRDLQVEDPPQESCRCGGNVRQGSRCCCLQHFLLSR